MDKLIKAELRRGLEARAHALGDEMITYLRLHWPRFVRLVDHIDSIIRENNLETGKVRILDIGPSFQTMIFGKTWPEARIDTFGFIDEKFPPPNGGIHYSYNITKLPRRLPALPMKPYDIIVMGEVIEHLYISPSYVFSFLASILEPGGFLIITTPNAVSLQHRWHMLCGQHPYELIREDYRDAGHFREYASAELNAYAHRFGLDSYNRWSGFDTAPEGPFERVLCLLTPMLPPSLRKHFTVTYRKA